MSKHFSYLIIPLLSFHVSVTTAMMDIPAKQLTHSHFSSREIVDVLRTSDNPATNIDLLSDHFDLLTQKRDDFNQSLKYAMQHNALAFMRRLLNSGNPLLKQKDMGDALKWAASMGQTEMMQLLLLAPRPKNAPRANQQAFNIAFEEAVARKRYETVEFMFTFSKNGIHQNGMNEAYTWAYYNNDRDMIALLNDAPDYVPQLNQWGVNNILEWTIRGGHLELITDDIFPSYSSWLTEDGINNAVEWAAYEGFNEILETLLTNHIGIPRPTQRGMNNAFKWAANQGFTSAMDVLATPRNRYPLPDVTGANDALLEAVKNQRSDVITYLFPTDAAAYLFQGNLNENQRFELPNERGVNDAFHYIVENSDRNLSLNLVRYFLQRCPVKPSQAHINDLFRALSNQGYRSINAVMRESLLDLIRPHVGRVERRAQQRRDQEQFENRQMLALYLPMLANDRHETPRFNSTSVAMEIHDYAKIVNPEVTTELQKRIRNTPLCYVGSEKKRINEWIAKYYAGNRDQKRLALHAFRQGWDSTTPQKITQIMTFLDLVKSERQGQLGSNQTEQPIADPFDLWMQGFIGESIIAYHNRQNKLSCVKGIDERMMTGLRGIDPTLDRIFEKAEGPLLVKNFLAALNVEQRYQALAAELMTRGIHTHSTAENATAVYRDFLEHHIESRHPNNAHLYEAEILAILDVVESIFADKIHPYITGLEGERALKAAQDQEYKEARETDLMALEDRLSHKLRHVQLSKEELRKKAAFAAQGRAKLAAEQRASLKILVEEKTNR